MFKYHTWLSLEKIKCGLTRVPVRSICNYQAHKKSFLKKVPKSNRDLRKFWKDRGESNVAC